MSKVHKILVVGAGQLGSRHLQALSKIALPVEIEVLDPFPASLTVARSRFDEMLPNPLVQGVRYLSDAEGVSTHIDFAIVATNADVRADVVRALLGRGEIRHMLLEKVLFQKLADHADIRALFELHGVKAWVNHPRRMFPVYQEVRAWLAGAREVSYQLNGGGWGLACNGLHFIDHLAFLTGEQNLVLSGAGLHDTTIPSKRQGFIEFSGALHGRLGPHPFALHCHAEPAPVLLTVSSEQASLVVDEAKGSVRFATKEGGWTWTERLEKIVRFQSELSHLVAQDVLGTGRCALPTYAEAVRLHVPFLRCLLDKLAQVDGRQYDACPIT